MPGVFPIGHDGHCAWRGNRIIHERRTAFVAQNNIETFCPGAQQVYAVTTHGVHKNASRDTPLSSTFEQLDMSPTA